MAAITLTGDSFEQPVTGDGIVLVDFLPGPCGPWLRFAPVLEHASEQHPDVLFAKVDIAAEPALAEALRIFSIPTLMAFRDVCSSTPSRALFRRPRWTRSLSRFASGTWTRCATRVVESAAGR
jgi:thiol-disulfide isomerase/thioredoxin